MKKRFLECKSHGLTLYRCKRIYRRKNKEEYYNEYSEKCFKCISEGNYSKKPVVREKKNKFISFR